MPADLADRWPLPDHDALRDELVAAYGTGRGYHDLRHLAEVLDRLDDLGCDDVVVLLAAWFHDAVYDGRPGDEERSAQWAERALPADLSAEVARLVRVTEHHDPAPEDEAGYLRVAHTDDPATDVVQDSERIEAAFRDGHADYERIRLEPTEYRGTDAALWEYTFTADGIPFHAIHLNVSTGDRGYALNHVVPASGWDGAADRFEQFTASFEFER